MFEQRADALERMKGIEIALLVAAGLVYDEPREDTLRGYVEAGVFCEAPFDTQDPAVERGLALLGAWCTSVAEGDFTEAVKDLQREHLRLFVGCGEPQVPSWATYYVDPNSQMFGQETLEVRKVYQSFSLRLSRVNCEPDDHLALMMRFLAHVLGLECEAVQKGDAQEAQRLHGVQEGFLVAHVLPWLPVWHYSGQKAASSNFFGGCVELVFGVLREYAALFGIAYRDNPPSFAKHRP